MKGNDPRVLRALADPAFYPHRPPSVEVVQTHISFVFLAGELVYKVKKPVDFGFLDFTTLEKRRLFCGEEIRLNRRLAPSVYLEVVPIREKGGRLTLGGEGETLEYAVVMRRLPAERMLKRIIGEEGFDPSVLDAVAAKVAAFHNEAATGGAIDDMGRLTTIRRNHEENFTQTVPYIGVTIDEGAYRFICDYARRFMAEKEELFARRVREKRIREGHGDLHLEHIIVGDEIVIFDCIEFNERFRCGDVTADVAFLSMDLDFNGYTGHGERFVRAYVEEAKDPGVLELIDFYRCYYAYVRGKVVSFLLNDPAVPPQEREAARERASRYFRLAYGYAARPARPVLILMAGLMGTGKSVLAREIAPLVGGEIIRTDVLRKELHGLDERQHLYEDFGAGIYGDDVSRKTYGEARRRALAILSRGRSVVIDASFKRREERRLAMAEAARAGYETFVVECVCPDEVVKDRLDKRQAEAGDASDGRWELYAAQKEDFDPVTEVEAGRHLKVDTTAPPAVCAQRILEMIKRGGGP